MPQPYIDFTVEELRRLESTERNSRSDMLNVCMDSDPIFRLQAPSSDTRMSPLLPSYLYYTFLSSHFRCTS